MDQNTTITDNEADRVLSGICIPPCPAILTKLMKEMRGDEPDFARIGQLISEDASLAAAMLRTVNSAFYGLRTKATSVRQAIILLGLREVRRLATRVLLRDAFSNGSSERMEQYWECSAAIAQISAFLANDFGGFDRDEVYTFALFRDCGMLAMMDSYQDYSPVLPGETLPGHGSVTALENQRHNINHARVGANLAKIWLLPEEIHAPILWHHDYATLRQGREKIEPAHARHIALVLVAEWIYVKQTTGTESPEWRKGFAFALQDLNTTMEHLEAVMTRTMQVSGVF
jgi:HD-like signal output (HDOD) protein